MQELTIQLTPKQREFSRAIDQFPVTFYGGARGGGKSYGLRNIMLLRRFKYPGTSGAIFRKSFPELEGNHIRPLFRQFPHLKPYYNESKKILSLPNGSTLEFSYCESEKDVDNYQGREYDDLGIEEAGQWTEVMVNRLRASNRSSKQGVKPRTILTGNPGGLGHQWLKRLFVLRQFKPTERPEDYHFIQSLVDDNPALLDNDPDYVRRLENEPNEAIRKAWRWGSWDVFAGQFFGEIRADIHLIKPFPIPHHWNRFGSYDFGFNHPAAFGWFASDSDGNVYLYRELIEAGLRVDQFANKVAAFEDTKQLYPIVAGHDCWAKKAVVDDRSVPTIAEKFLEYDITLKRAAIDRIVGAAQVRAYLAHEGRPGGRPRFFIFNTCPISFDCLTRMQHDPDRAEDVLKVDAVQGDVNTGDDPYDMIRYGLMSRPVLSEVPRETHPYGSEKWAAQQVTDMEEAAEAYFSKQKDNYTEI